MKSFLLAAGRISLFFSVSIGLFIMFGYIAGPTEKSITSRTLNIECGKKFERLFIASWGEEIVRTRDMLPSEQPEQYNELRGNAFEVREYTIIESRCPNSEA
jgi:hypothetical protein